MNDSTASAAGTPRRVLITGGTGFLGSHTALALLGAGREVVLMDNLDNSRPDVADQVAAIYLGGVAGKSVADLADLVAASPALVVEAADAAPERALFHLYNLARERGGWLLLVAGVTFALQRLGVTESAGFLVEKLLNVLFVQAEGLLWLFKYQHVPLPQAFSSVRARVIASCQYLC